MKASIIAASAALVASVAAYDHKAHAAFHLRRGDYKQEEVCTVYTTVYVTAMPSMVANSTSVVMPKPSTPCTEEQKTSIYTPVQPSSVYVKPSPPPAPVSSKPAEVYTPPAPAYTPAPAPSKPVEYSPPAPPAPVSSTAVEQPKPSGGYSSGGRIVTNGQKWAITYTPYASSGQCKTQGEIVSDIQQIANMGFTTIRSYSTDCGVFEYVVPECQKHGLKVIYGIFLEGGGKGTFSDYANQQLEEIKDNAPKDSVAMVIVGNECMFNNNCSPEDLASYIDHVRQELQGAGFPTDIAITTTEPVNVWEEKGAALCDHIDVFAVQIHPYFTSSVTADMAGDFAKQQLAQASKVCPGAAAKGAYITEIGWPAGGDNNGMAVASPEAQKVAIKQIQDTVGSESCLFSFQNDGWKAPGDLGVEQFFGCADALN